MSRENNKIKCETFLRNTTYSVFVDFCIFVAFAKIALFGVLSRSISKSDILIAYPYFICIKLTAYTMCKVGARNAVDNLFCAA